MPLKLISASSDMHCEVFKKVGTNFWYGAVGVDHEEHVQALKNRNERHNEASRKKKSKRENMVKQLDKGTQENAFHAKSAMLVCN